MSTLLAAALAGFATLAIEIVGVHQLSPWFGASALVWSNQIGVILLAMAAGGWLGGRRARASPQPARLAGLLLIGAGLLAAIAVTVLPWFAAWLLPDALRLEEAAGVFLGGSLAAALLFFAPPVFLLAMVTPLLVEARAAAGAGRAAGEIYAAGTIGSLLGVFGSTWLALPWLGVRWTLAATALLLLLAGLLLAGRRRPAPAAALALLTLLAPDPAVRANLPDPAARILESAQTPYQYLRVIELPGGERWMQMNEGLDSYQSVWRPELLWPGGYYDLFALAPLYALDGADPTRPLHFWSLGYGAGAAIGPVAVALRGREWSAVGIEIDPRAIAMGARWMPLPPELAARLRLHTGDARALLRAAPADLDFILLDAYARQFEIPAHLATEEFFAEVASHLRPGGVLAINVGTARTPGRGQEFLDALSAAVGRTFGSYLRLHPVPTTRNAVLFARKERPLPALDSLVESLPPNSPDTLGAACFPEQVVDGLPAAGERYRDDRNRVQWAQLRLWLEGGA